VTWYRMKTDGRDWEPDGAHGVCLAVDLTEGTTVAYEYRAWTVHRVAALPEDRWPDRFVDAYEKEILRRMGQAYYRNKPLPSRTEWAHRPVAVSLKAPDGGRQCVTGGASIEWYTLGDHYAVCVRCGDVSPCREKVHDRIARTATGRMERDLLLMPGCCMGCNTPVTSRQQSVTFDGPNLIRPDWGDGTAVFHLKSECSGSALAYDKRLSEETGVPRRLFCEGTLVVHADRTRQCNRADCPGGRMLHRCTLSHYESSPGGPAGPVCWCVKDAWEVQARKYGVL
jgi:hypothetical protein